MKEDKAGLKEKISFGIGSMAYCVEMVLVLTYFMIFCSDVMNINVAIIGVVMAAVKILDAVSDILITNLADKTRGRWGRYRIWLLNGIPLAFILVLMFSDPSFLTGATAKVVWISILYIILVPVLETAVSCPYMAMIITMSPREDDRLDFSMARALGEAGSQIVVSLLVMPIILHFGGYRNIEGWRVMSVVIALIIVAASVICFLGTKERLLNSNTDQEGKNLSLIQKIRVLHKNAPFWKLIFVIVFFMAHYYASSTLFTYYCIHVLGHEEWISGLLTTGFVFQIAVTILLFYLGRKLEKRSLLFAGAILIIAANGILYFATSFVGATVYQCLLGIGNGIFNAIAFSMLPDVADYTEWKSGIALPGMISAIATFAMKLGGAVAVFLVSRILIWGGYDETAVVQSAYTKNFIHICLPVSSTLCLAAAAVISLLLREITHRKVEQYRREIDRQDRELPPGNEMMNAQSF